MERKEIGPIGGFLIMKMPKSEEKMVLESKAKGDPVFYRSGNDEFMDAETRVVSVKRRGGGQIEVKVKILRHLYPE